MTAPYTENVVQGEYRQPVKGASVFLLNEDGSLATTSGANPTVTDSFGFFTFTADDGVYLRDVRVAGVSYARDSILIGSPPQFVGGTGPADNTYTSLTALLASDKTRKKANLVGDTDVPPAADGPFNVVAGQWARQGAGGIGFTAAGAGAVTRTVEAKLREGAVNVKDYGTVGDGVTDDGPAIRRAIAACGELRNLYFPAGTYLVKQDGANPWCLKKVAVNRWFGDTMAHSCIMPDPSIPDTCDAVVEVASAIYASRGGGCSDLAIESPVNGRRPGRHGWHVDTSMALIPDLQINGNTYERLRTGIPTASTPGFGFCHTNDSSLNSDGGMYCSGLIDCVLSGGFRFIRTGDSNFVRGGRMTGPRPNYIDQAINAGGSANTFLADGCNVTNDGGLLQVANAPGLIVCNWNSENFDYGAATFNGAAAIWLKAPPAWSGSSSYKTGDLVSWSGAIYYATSSHTNHIPSDTGFWAPHDPFENASFHNNLFAAATNFDGTAVVRVDAGNRVTFSGNRMAIGKLGIKAFLVQGLTTNVDLRGNTYSVGLPLTDRLVNSATGTLFDSFALVTQDTSKSTDVTLNTSSGSITMNGSALAAGASTAFLLNSNLIAANSVVSVSIRSGATSGAYAIAADNVSTGACRISVRNLTAAPLSEAIVLNYVILSAGI